MYVIINRGKDIRKKKYRKRDRSFLMVEEKSTHFEYFFFFPCVTFVQSLNLENYLTIFEEWNGIVFPFDLFIYVFAFLMNAKFDYF